MPLDSCKTCYREVMDQEVMHAFRTEAAAQALPILKAMEEAFKEWTDNRRYLRAGNGKTRFGNLSKQMLSDIEKRKENHELEHID